MSKSRRRKIFKIVVTGGTGRFGKVLKKVKTNHKMIFPNKEKLNITKINSIEKFLVKNRPDIVIHLAALSRPMKIHDKNIINVSDMYEVSLPEMVGFEKEEGFNFS